MPQLCRFRAGIDPQLEHAGGSVAGACRRYSLGAQRQSTSPGRRCCTAAQRQNRDGSWFYGEAPKYHWIDSFHTGYNLDSLKRYVDSTNEKEFVGHLSRGYKYFKHNFFEI